MLPFDTSPQQESKLVGNSKVGALRFPIFYGLLVIEQINISKSLRELSAYVLACELAEKIEVEQQVDLLLAYNAVVNNISDSKEEDLLQIRRIRIRYARKIEGINNFSEVCADEERVVTVTEIITRIQPDWTIQKTHKLPTPLFNEIWKFANQEISGWAEAENVAPTKEDIKKRLDESPSLPTGQMSFGESRPTGEGMSDLIQATSQSSHAG